MKKILKKFEILLLVLVILLSCSIAVSAESKVEFVDCLIKQVGVSSSGFQEKIQLKTVDTNGIETIYTCASKVLVNGSSYINAEDIYNAIGRNSFAKIALEDGAVKVVNCGGDSVSYENIEYKEKKGCFNTLDAKHAGLPVYYNYNGDFVPAHADGNHYYDIEVYDYAICINEIRPKKASVGIDFINISSAISGNYSQNIEIYCEADMPGGSMFVCEIYDEDNSLVGEEKSDYGEFYFGNLENKTKTYTLKLWIEDEEGGILSNEYIKKHTVKAAEVKYVKALQKAVDENSFKQIVQLKTVDTSGTQTVYDFAKRVRINGSLCTDAEEIYNAVQTDRYVKMALEDGVIKVLNFSDGLEMYDNAEYDSESASFVAEDMQIGKLPVYYIYNDDFVPAYVDENHYYDIEVYDYAVCINDMKPKTYEGVIDFIDIGRETASDFTQSINVYCEYESESFAMLCVELYDENGALIDEGRSDFGELNFRGLPNEALTYTLKLWLEDEEGRALSSEYIKEYTVESAEIKNAMISRKAVSESFLGEIVMLKTVDANGKETVYNCADIIRINGRRYRDTMEIHDIIEENSFAVMAVENGVVTVLNFGSSANSYDNAEYNEETQSFVVDGMNIEKLPVYYNYYGDYVTAFADGNHYYDIEVYDYAICINGMRSKTDAEVIYFIDISSAISSDFSQVINVYCETEDKPFTLKGRIYDEKINLIAKKETECFGFGELTFEHLKNKSANCTIELWLEDESGEKVSNVYSVPVKIEQNTVKYGNVTIKYTTGEDSEKMFLSVRNFDGTEEVYLCNENTFILNEVSLMSYGNILDEIPENTFVKMAVEDGMVSAILVEPCDLEVYAPGYSYDGMISGDAYVINNTEESHEFTCYVAVYNDSNALKFCDIIPITVDAGDFVPLAPDFGEYECSEGDYLKIFAWEDGNLRPLSIDALAEIDVK